MLYKTKKIVPQINKNDKYPIWDGELLVYNSSNFNKNNLFCRVPVQVKSELLKGDAEDKTTYDISISDLKKYAEEGGILFIKIIYDEKNEFGYIYMNIIMKGDISDIFKNINKEQKTKRIILDRVDNEKEIITICENFKLHRELQMQIPENIDLSKIKDSTKLYTYSYINDVHDLVKKEQYVYAKLDYNILMYVGKIKNRELINDVHVNAETKNKVYFNHIKVIYTESKTLIKIGNYVEISDNRIIINNNLNENVNLDDTINELEFMNDLYKNKKLKIGDSEFFDFNFDLSEKIIKERINRIENNIIYLKEAKKIISAINIPTNKIELKDVIKEETNICKINRIINEGFLIELPGIESEKVINEVDVAGMKILLYFIRQDNGKYKGYDFLYDDIVLNNMVVNDSGKVQLSRYYNLPYNVLCLINLDEDKMVLELKKSTKNEITISYINYLMLEFIKAYDYTKNERFLKIAMRINKILRKQREYYSETMYKINKYQVLKRINQLSSKDRDSLVEMKVKSDDLVTKCSCCILLDNYKEFKLLFDKLDIDKKKLFKTWSIFEIVPEDLKKRI